MIDSMNVLVVDDERDVELLFRQRFRKEIRRGEISLHFAALLDFCWTGRDAILTLGVIS